MDVVDDGEGGREGGKEGRTGMGWLKNRIYEVQKQSNSTVQYSTHPYRPLVRWFGWGRGGAGAGGK